MSLEELIASLTSEAESEREKILQDAEEAAGRVLAQAREEAERLGQKPKMEAAVRLSTERAKRLHAARVRGRSLVRQARGEVMDLLAGRVLELAAEFSRGGEYARCLEELLAEAAAGMAGGTVLVRTGDLQAAAAAAARLNGSFRVDTRGEMPPGVVVISEDGLVETDNTLPTRLKSYLSLREPEVAALVFGGERHA